MMIPVIIEDLIKKVTDKRMHVEQRQFYYTSLLLIRDQIQKAIAAYEKEKNGL